MDLTAGIIKRAEDGRDIFSVKERYCQETDESFYRNSNNIKDFPPP
jgi:hypothetical protein